MRADVVTSLAGALLERCTRSYEHDGYASHRCITRTIRRHAAREIQRPNVVTLRAQEYARACLRFFVVIRSRSLRARVSPANICSANASGNVCCWCRFSDLRSSSVGCANNVNSTTVWTHLCRFVCDLPTANVQSCVCEGTCVSLWTTATKC